MSSAQGEHSQQRRSRVGYIRSRPIAPGYNISWNEVFTRGPALYEKMRGDLEAKHPGQYVIIDVVSGEYEIDSDEDTAALRLHSRFPGVKPWTMQIGGLNRSDGTKSGD